MPPVSDAIGNGLKLVAGAFPGPFSIATTMFGTFESEHTSAVFTLFFVYPSQFKHCHGRV
jgi:hypothetical protein